MLITEAEIRVMLGLTSSITDEERAVLNLITPAAEARVVEHLGYHPEQAVATEYYPRSDAAGGFASGAYGWDVTSSHRRAEMYAAGGAGPVYPTLQLERLPVRQVLAVRVDYSARFGSAAGAFPNDTAWTEGTDFYAEWEEPGFCRSGCLFASGAWPSEPGTVRVQYRAGYSPEELQGRATTTFTAADGTITTARVNASGIKRAALITAVKAVQSWASLRKSTRTGFTPGVIQSENLGDYSYSLAASSALAGLVTALPAEAAELLEPFVHWGQMRL